MIVGSEGIIRPPEGKAWLITNLSWNNADTPPRLIVDGDDVGAIEHPTYGFVLTQQVYLQSATGATTQFQYQETNRG